MSENWQAQPSVSLGFLQVHFRDSALLPNIGRWQLIHDVPRGSVSPSVRIAPTGASNRSSGFYRMDSDIVLHISWHMSYISILSSVVTTSGSAKALLAQLSLAPSSLTLALLMYLSMVLFSPRFKAFFSSLRYATIKPKEQVDYLSSWMVLSCVVWRAQTHASTSHTCALAFHTSLLIYQRPRQSFHSF